MVVLIVGSHPFIHFIALLAVQARRFTIVGGAEQRVASLGDRKIPQPTSRTSPECLGGRLGGSDTGHQVLVLTRQVKQFAPRCLQTRRHEASSAKENLRAAALPAGLTGYITSPTRDGALAIG